jgi:putative transcriptional regulator
MTEIGIMPYMVRIGRVFLCLIFATCTAGPFAARLQAQQQAPAAGKLLIAAPELDGSGFGSTVVLLVHHNDEGTIGLMINRPTEIEPASAFPDSELLRDYEGRLYFGGPVAAARPLLLVRGAARASGDRIEVLRGVYLQGSLDSLNGLSPDMLNDSRIRIFAGHAEWAPGQLAAEIAAGGWQIADARADQVFTSEPLRLWGRMRLSGAEEVVRRD